MSELVRSVFGSCKVESLVVEACDGKAKLVVKAEIRSGRTFYVFSGPQKYFSRKDAERLEATMEKIRLKLEVLREEVEEE